MTAPALSIAGLRVAYGPQVVLDDVSFDVADGEFVSVLGPSGSGKSTLLGVLTGGVAAQAGALAVRGEPVHRLDPAAFAYMPQTDVLLPWRRVIDNATLGLEARGVRRARARETVAPMFAEFGIAGTERLYPAQLSGGMRQRVALLRTVAQHRGLLLLDEPFGALDAITRAELQRWIVGMWERHRWTVVLITHDIREAILLSDRVLVLSQKPARVLEDIRVPREGHRTEEFLHRPDIAAIESRLLGALLPAASTTGTGPAPC
ncbi:ABC transporter ATP-binding protein [Microbacterium sp. 18062]|uniref:ABC transporter ATP-binding protein n=1 Tax=Microbacterium sp. 18062 TaxID=2681410 RepID=UPI00135B8D49|nr:ABC transporter ATP-binding protein [Microbacterium sp. 18062]